MQISIDNKLRLSSVPPDFRKAIMKRLTFKNPKWIENNKRGFWNGRTPKNLHGFKETENGLMIPRGFAGQLIRLCRKYGTKFRLVDDRRVLPDIAFQFNGILKPFQEEACHAVLSRDFGTLQAPTGSGKTVMALHAIAARKQPALIVVHTKELLNQWIDRIHSFLDIPISDIGIIGGGKKKIGDKITVALVQSLYKCANEVAPYIGHLIVDECHRAPSRTFTEAVGAFDSRFMLGLSATPFRRDGLSRLIFWHLGDLMHEVDKERLVNNGDILKPEIVVRETIFSTCLDASEEYGKVLSELTQDPARNRMICRDVAKEVRNGSGICLVLSDRKAHCGAIQGLLANEFKVQSVLLTGALSKKKRENAIEKLNSGGLKILVATGQLIGEGFDLKELSTLFLATPIKFSGRVLQYLGRVLRSAPGKSKASVYDYVDTRVGVLKASGEARQRVYETMA